MIRPSPRPGIERRQLLRFGFLGALSLAGAEAAGSLLPFLQVRKIVGLGVPVNVGPKAALLAAFTDTNDAPILFRQGHFFLLHAPGGIIAAYRKCTHLGCAVPFSIAEDRFHCRCHGSIYDKRTALLIHLAFQTAGFGARPLTDEPSRNVSLAVAFLVIAIPVGAVHFWLILRSFATPAERTADVRHQYLNLWIAFGLLVILFSTQT